MNVKKLIKHFAEHNEEYWAEGKVLDVRQSSDGYHVRVENKHLEQGHETHIVDPLEVLAFVYGTARAAL